MKMTSQVIVIAWADFTGVRETGEFERFDGVNYRPKVERCLKGNAVVWSRNASDFDSASRHAESISNAENRKVFVLDDSENVLDVARGLILTNPQSIGIK